MKTATKLLTVISMLSVFFLSGAGALTYAEDEVFNTASGKMTANGKTYEIKYSYADEGPDDIILVLSDSALPGESIPFGLQQLAVEGKVRGLVVTISRETKGLAPGLNAIYDKSWDGQLGTLGNAVLKIDKFDSGIIEGRISTPEENTFSDYKFSFDVKFKTSLGQPKKTAPVEVTIKGDDSPAAAAYAEYYRALMSGDVTALKKLIIKENAERLDDETAAMIVDIAQAAHPREIEIVTKNTSDKSAELVVKGSVDNSQGTGTVSMLFEDGQWKVEKDNWKFQD